MHPVPVCGTPIDAYDFAYPNPAGSTIEPCHFYTFIFCLELFPMMKSEDEHWCWSAFTRRSTPFRLLRWHIWLLLSYGRSCICICKCSPNGGKEKKSEPKNMIGIFVIWLSDRFSFRMIWRRETWVCGRTSYLQVEILGRGLRYYKTYPLPSNFWFLLFLKSDCGRN